MNAHQGMCYKLIHNMRDTGCHVQMQFFIENGLQTYNLHAKTIFCKHRANASVHVKTLQIMVTYQVHDYMKMYMFNLGKAYVVDNYKI